jgi:DNA-binding NtrC family response regulator
VSGDSGHPTVLVVYEKGEFRDVLIRNLEQKGCLILQAQDSTEAFEIVIRHSRSIHLLLAHDSTDSRVMVEKLKPYRPDMKVIHLGSNLEINSLLMEIFQVLDRPPSPSEDEKSLRAKVRAALRAEAPDRRIKPKQEKKQ